MSMLDFRVIRSAKTYVINQVQISYITNGLDRSYGGEVGVRKASSSAENVR
jgi:hypothetical protein